MSLKHIAIIMDGNGRWAVKRGLPRSEGHRAGSRAAGRVAKAVKRMGIPYLTLYALSTENLYRPQEELDALMALLREYLDNEAPKLGENKVRLRVIGDRSLLPQDVQEKIKSLEKKTAKDYEMTLCLAVCYGARDEIARAARKLARNLNPDRITEARLQKALDTADLPDPDLLIRTGGEKRLSNFLLWQMAYTELYFTRTLWPDFSAKHLRRAVDSFHKRQRRFGRTDRQHLPDPKAATRKKGILR